METKTEKNLLQELNNTLPDDNIKQELNKDIKFNQNQSAQRKIEINMNILKWKLYNIDIADGWKSPANKAVYSPFGKSRNSWYVDSNVKKIG